MAATLPLWALLASGNMHVRIAQLAETKGKSTDAAQHEHSVEALRQLDASAIDQLIAEQRKRHDELVARMREREERLYGPLEEPSSAWTEPESRRRSLDGNSPPPPGVPPAPPAVPEPPGTPPTPPPDSWLMERDVLRQLYESTGGSQWRSNSRWQAGWGVSSGRRRPREGPRHVNGEPLL